MFAGEALLHGYISGYQNTVEDGQVEVEKVRISRFAGRDSLSNVVFIGGPFCFALADFVKRRSGFLKGDMANYRYQLIDETLYDNRPTYVISFESKQSSSKNKRRGLLHIDKETLAYRFIEQAGQSDSTSINSGTVEGSKAKTFYRFMNGRWYLQYVTVSQSNRKTSKRVVASADLMITDIDTTHAQPIPYANRLAYGDVFYNLPNNYTTSFWEDYTTLVPETALGVSIDEARISSLNSVEEKPVALKGISKQALVKILMKLGYHIGIRYAPSALDYLPASFQLIYVPTQQIIKQQTKANFPLPIYLSTGIGYTFNKRFSAQYASATTFGHDVSLKLSQLTASYHLLLKKWGNPLFLKPTVGYYWQTNLRLAGQLDNTSRSIVVSSQSFRTDQVDLFLGTRRQGFVASLRFEQKLKDRKWLYLNTGLNVERSSELSVLGKEATGFPLFRRSQLGPASDQPDMRLSDVVMPQYSLKTGLFAEIGLRFGLF